MVRPSTSTDPYIVRQVRVKRQEKRLPTVDEAGMLGANQYETT